MNTEKSAPGVLLLAVLALAFIPAANAGQANRKPPDKAETSYIPVAIKEDFATVMKRMAAEKDDIMERQMRLLNERYDLANRPARGVTMSGGKPVQEGVRVKLPRGTSWEKLAGMTPEEIRRQDLFPRGFMPLPHPNHPEGGMVFPEIHIKEILEQEGRDLTRFDLDFDFPDHVLPEFPPPMFLVQRPDLGDVSQGEVITIKNFNRIFNGLLNPKQLEGLRLLVTPFPQQQFNATEDRRSEEPSQGVTCFDCHVNGHTNSATHLAGDARPQAFRHRIETPPLRGVNVQRLFGSQRALKTVEDFTEFEQRGAYFDADIVTAAKKGVNVLERGGQVHHMAEFQAFLDFPPAPKLGWDGKLDPAKATEAELRGQEVFFGKGKCSTCHVPPYYTDNTMHDLKLERFFEPRMINNHWAMGDGKIKTFPLRGIKDSPTYLHDGRLITLDDTVEFFNLVLQLELSKQEKSDLVQFMRAL